MKIKDLTTGQIFEYGSNRHHALRISDDGRTLSFENLQNGDGSEYGDYRFIDDCDEQIPEETECNHYGADSYFNIGGFGSRCNMIIKGYADGMLDKAKEIVQEVAEEYNGGWIPCSERLPSGLDFVLYTHKDGEVDICSIEYFYDYLDKFTAWQPLPEPYKERD